MSTQEDQVDDQNSSAPPSTAKTNGNPVNQEQPKPLGTPTVSGNSTEEKTHHPTRCCGDCRSMFLDCFYGDVRAFFKSLQCCLTCGWCCRDEESTCCLIFEYCFSPCCCCFAPACWRTNCPCCSCPNRCTPQKICGPRCERWCGRCVCCFKQERVVSITEPEPPVKPLECGCRRCTCQNFWCCDCFPCCPVFKRSCYNCLLCRDYDCKWISCCWNCPKRKKEIKKRNG